MSARPVLFLVDTLARGGLAQVVVTVANRLQSRGHPVGIAVLDGTVDVEPVDGVWLARSPAPRASRSGRALRSHAARFGLDAIADFTRRAGAPHLIIAAGELALRCAPC